MRPNTISALSFIGAATLARSTCPNTQNSDDCNLFSKIKTTSGIVQGKLIEENGVSAYLGIPYAQPPVNGLRWQPPRPFTSDEYLNSTAFGPICYESSPTGEEMPTPGPDSNLTEAGEAISLALSTYGLSHSEDCLTLNIWVKHELSSVLPHRETPKKAVLIFIHGGSFASGSSAIPGYNGQNLVAEHASDIIVVSFNYRLSILGFPGGPSMPPNLGVLDARLAIEWVRNNIASFGGDLSRITFFGQSAGGSMIDILSYAYPTDPIAAGMILMSGFAQNFNIQNSSTALSNWNKAVKNAGCATNTTSAQEIACMSSLPASQLFSSLPLEGISSSGLPFGPSPDNTLVFPNTQYTTLLPAPIPLLLGTTDAEADLYPYLLSFPPSEFPPREWFTAITNTTFTCPCALRAAKHISLKIKTWRYRYFGSFPNTILGYKPWTTGAWHGSDVPSIFNTIPQCPLSNTNEEDAITAYHRGAWVAFAKDPMNGLGLEENGYGWPEYDPDTESLVRIGWRNLTGANLVRGDEYDEAC